MSSYIVYIFSLILMMIPVTTLHADEPDNRAIQTSGKLFTTVQMGRVFPDSKTFVDCIPKNSPQKVMAAYVQQKTQPGFDLTAFIKDNFNLPESTEQKAGLPKHLSMEEYIEGLWDFLTRKPDENQEYSTLLPLPYPFIVPGGRFREVYYWDSYFTSVGLVVSGKIDLVENMTRNFAQLIHQVGHVPNGNRSYYISRSQPPFFCSMVDLIAHQKGVQAALPYLDAVEKEYSYWMEGVDNLSLENPSHLKVVRLEDGSILNRYYDYKDTPREESYREDIELCEDVQPKNKAKLYRDIRSAAESGWDFSSRWFKDNKTMASIRTTEIVPVDLNAILYSMELKLSSWNKAAGNTQKAKFYQQAAEKRKKAINTYCWNEDSGFYFDYCFTEKKQTATWSLAASFPLFFGAATQNQADKVAIQLKNKFLFPGGLVTTLSENTGQQWDSPNAWAPLQWISIKGLEQYNHTALAKEIQQAFITTARNFYQESGKMVEKYDVCNTSKSAGGGEYELQEGFGWTNGVIIGLLNNSK